MKDRLTIKRIERAGPGRHADGGNLYLQVSKSRMKSWVFRYAVGAREVMLGLGPLSVIDLEEARKLARSYRRLLLEGRDPLTEARATRERNRAATASNKTVKEVIDEYLDKHGSRWGAEKIRQRFTAMMRDYVEPLVGNLPVSLIEDTHILQILEQEVPAFRSHPAGPLHLARRKSAGTLRVWLRDIFDFAKARRFRAGDNPAVLHVAALPKPKHDTPKGQHYASMPYGQLPEFMIELRSKNTTRRAALELIILTACRTGEALGAQWSEINLEERLWVIPAARMKARKEHRVPLSTTAIALLRRQPRALGNDDHVFPGAKGPLSDRTVAKMLRDMRPGLTVHGFRSSFRVWCSEKTTARHDVIEAALAHQVGSEVERSYNRSDLLNARRALMQDWADYIGTATDKVVKLRAKKS